MNTALKTFQFDDIPVSIVDHGGEGWMIGEDIGKALDYNHPKDSIQNIFDRNREELEEYSVTIKLMATDGKQYDTRVYNEEGVMMIGFFSKQPKAVAFRKWAVIVLKAYRHNPSPSSNAESQKLLEMKDQILAQQYNAIAFLQTQLDKSQSHASGMYSLYEAEAEKVRRLERAKGPVKPLERRDIFDKLDDGWDVPKIAKWLYRSTAFVRAVIKAGRYV